MSEKVLTPEEQEYVNERYDVIHPVLVEYALKNGGGGVTDPFNGYEYVDMGEAGIWAKYPIGISEWNDDWENNIKYFAWGETEGYTKSQVGVDKEFSYDWRDYKWCDGNKIYLTKYCNDSHFGNNEFVDNLTTLLPEDDASTTNMGGNWRMPTTEEFQKLNSLCNYEWVYNYNGVSDLVGALFKLKTDESKQLFFPAAGYCKNGSVDSVRSSGFLWSSSLNISDTCRSTGLYINMNYVISDNVDERYFGYSVVGFLGSGQ